MPRSVNSVASEQKEKNPKVIQGVLGKKKKRLDGSEKCR